MCLFMCNVWITTSKQLENHKPISFVHYRSFPPIQKFLIAVIQAQNRVKNQNQNTYIKYTKNDSHIYSEYTYTKRLSLSLDGRQTIWPHHYSIMIILLTKYFHTAGAGERACVQAIFPLMIGHYLVLEHSLSSHDPIFLVWHVQSETHQGLARGHFELLRLLVVRLAAVTARPSQHHFTCKHHRQTEYQ